MISLALLLAAAEPSLPEPQAPLASLFTTDDYPKEALRADEQGTVGFRLAIDTRGAIAGCEITQTSGYKSLDEATCLLLTTRAKFKPARDAAGRPIAGAHSSRIVWRIPEDQSPPDFSKFPGLEAGMIVFATCVMSATVARAPSPPTTDDADVVLNSCVAQRAQLAAAWPKDPVIDTMDWLIEGHRKNIERVLGILRAAPKQP